MRQTPPGSTYPPELRVHRGIRRRAMRPKHHKSEVPDSISSFWSVVLSTNFSRERARVAVLTRHRHPADPELIDARRRMGEESLIVAVRNAVAKAPPITPEISRRVMNLLAVAGRGAE